MTSSNSLSVIVSLLSVMLSISPAHALSASPVHRPRCAAGGRTGLASLKSRCARRMEFRLVPRPGKTRPMAGRSWRSVPIDREEVLERARSEVAHIVNVVVLEQFCDAAALFRPHRNLQQQVTVPQRLVVDCQRCPVVAEPLKGRMTRPRSPW